MHPPCAATASLSLTPAVLIRPLADKMSAGELDQAFREAVTGDGPDGGWSIKNDERVKYVGKLEVAKGEDTTLKVREQTRPHTRPLLPATLSPPPPLACLRTGHDGGLPRGWHVGAQVLHDPVVHQVNE